LVIGSYETEEFTTGISESRTENELEIGRENETEGPERDAVTPIRFQNPLS
jgi:hypothetical protein